MVGGSETKMTEIVDDRGDISVTYKSWKAYAKALQREVRCLQQFLTSDRVEACFKASVKEKVRV